MSLLKLIKNDAILSQNISSNLLGNVWVAFVTLISVPILYRELSPEGYALVGMFILISQWVAFLDVGLGAALSRYVAANRNASGGLERAQYMMHRFEFLSVLVIALSLSTVILLGNFIYQEGLYDEIYGSIFFWFVLSICIRVQLNLYKSGLMGLEKQVYVSIVNIVSVSIRFGIPVLIAYFGDLSLSDFFRIQLIASIGEVLTQRLLLSRILGAKSEKIAWKGIFPHIKFGFSVAGLSVVWIAFSQLDKLILSNILPLAIFGKVMLIIQLSSAVFFVGAPIQAAILPRLTSSIASLNTVEATKLYTNASIVWFSVGVAVSFAIAVAADPVLNYISDEPAFEKELSWMILLYCLGNVLVVVMSLAYALQNAAGWLRAHWIGSVIFLVLQIPFLYLAAISTYILFLPLIYLLFGALYLVFWLYFAHSRLLSVSHWWWVFNVFPRSTVTAFLVGLTSIYFSKSLLLNYPILQLLLSLLVFFLIVVVLLRRGGSFFTGIRFE